MEIKKQGFFILIAVLTAIILSVSYTLTAPLFEKHLEEKQQESIDSMLKEPGAAVKKEQFELIAPEYLKMGDVQKATRVYDENGPSMIIVRAFAKGYNGHIALTISFDKSCTIGSVQILHEKETPGLGDQYKKDNHAWLTQFSGKNTQNARFELTKQGGDFDAWSGATVTPEAIVSAVKRTLDMCAAFHKPLFSTDDQVYAQL